MPFNAACKLSVPDCMAVIVSQPGVKAVTITLPTAPRALHKLSTIPTNAVAPAVTTENANDIEPKPTASPVAPPRALSRSVVI